MVTEEGGFAFGLGCFLGCAIQSGASDVSVDNPTHSTDMVIALFDTAYQLVRCGI